MNELLAQYWVLILVALIIGIVVAWFVFAANRKTRVVSASAEKESEEPARRNQTLIDAPPAAQAVEISPATPAGLAGAGKAAAVAVVPEDEHAGQASEQAPDRIADDLTRLKGVGPKLNTLLCSLGVNSFDQIANWTDADIDRIDAQLGNFQGRIRRDNWVEQARFLAKGDTAGFESQFGKL